MSQINTNTIKGVGDNDDVVFKTNNTTRITIASAGNVTLPTTTATSLSAPSVSAVNTSKAWCIYDGNNGGVVGNKSYNVSSVTNPSGTLNQVNFTVPMSGVDYVVVASCTRTSTNNGDIGVEYLTQAAASVRLQAGNSGGVFDSTVHEISMTVFDTMG
jgi:hypothetical protein